MIIKIFFFVVSALAETTDWQSQEGLKRLSESQYKVDFPSISNQFQNQLDKISCGPTTGAIVLNALRLGKKEGIPKISLPQKYKRYLPRVFDPRVSRYSPESFMNPAVFLKNSWKRKTALQTKSLKQLYGKPLSHGEKDLGLQLRQMHHIFLAHGVDSTLRVVGKELSEETIKPELIKNLRTKNDYVVINYKRPKLGQKGGGHISPLGAYHRKTDSFLIMDVNSTRYNWVWVTTEKLIESMRTFDSVENRGYLLLKDKLNQYEKTQNKK